MKIKKEPQTCVIAMIFFAVCMSICFMGASAVEKEDTDETSERLELTIESAEIESASGVSGLQSVSFSGDVITVETGTFTFPGAYSEIAVTVVNSGTLTAYLESELSTDCGLEGISVSFPEFGEAERIEPNERCGFSLTVKWDEDSDVYYSDTETASFSLKLSYVSDTDSSSAEVSSSDSDSSSVEDSLSDSDSSSVEDSFSDSDSSSVEERSSDTDSSSVEDSSSDSGSSSVEDSSSDTDSSSVADSTSDPNSSAADNNAATGAVWGRRILLFMSAVFAFFTVMCAVQLFGGKEKRR